MIGPQKALGGQAGVSALSVSPAAWARMAPPGEAPSILSLADQRALWLEAGRGALPGTPSALEFHALAQTLARVEAEGLAAIQARHRRAAAAARAGAKVLTGRAWVAEESASNLVTAAALPDGLDAGRVLAAAAPGHALSAGVGPAGERLIRLNHTGPRARLDVVLGDLVTLARALSALGQSPTSARRSPPPRLRRCGRRGLMVVSRSVVEIERHNPSAGAWLGSTAPTCPPTAGVPTDASQSPTSGLRCLAAAMARYRSSCDIGKPRRQTY